GEERANTNVALLYNGRISFLPKSNKVALGWTGNYAPFLRGDTVLAGCTGLAQMNFASFFDLRILVGLGRTVSLRILREMQVFVVVVTIPSPRVLICWRHAGAMPGNLHIGCSQEGHRSF
ncbi:unnamed protein product, partial [Ectocarpus sp. 13 AM-2016]